MKKIYFLWVAILLSMVASAQSYVTEIGQTLYDLQTNATIGARVIADEYGVSAVWTRGMEPTTFPDRGTGYNHLDPISNTWAPMPTSRIESFRTGWPSLVHTADGNEWVFAHNGSGIQSLKRDLINGGNWQEMGVIPSAAGEPILWNRACSGGPDGNTIHMVASTTVNGALIDGMDQQVLYYRSQNGGLSWDITDMTFEGTSAPMYGFGGDTYAMSASGNTVAVACFGSLQDSYVWISFDNGSNWTRYTFHDFPLDNYIIDSGTDVNGDGIEDAIASTSTSGSVVVDGNGVVHVSYATMDYIDPLYNYDGQFSYFPATGQIRYWNSAYAGSPLDVSDDLNVVAGVAPNMVGGSNINWNQMGAYGFGGLVNHPSVVTNDNGDLLILFDGVKEGSMENGIYRRHLFMVKSIDGGLSWSEPTDVSPNIDGINWEYNYACAAPRVYNGKVHMTAQRDLVPGFSTNAPSAADYNMNSIVYVAIDAENLAPIINGCTDPTACNFAAEATVDDGSCILVPTDEVCDGVDNDCNGVVDNGVIPTWNQDSDGDGFGSSSNGIWIGCETIPGYVLDNSDCDDNAVMYTDMDADGFGTSVPTGCGSYNTLDCNDADPNVAFSYYTPDFDADGFGDFYNYYQGCSAQPGYILYQAGVTQLDCFDNDPNAVGGAYYGEDQDGDGYANWNVAYWGCFADPGFVYIDVNTSDPDCDDFSLTFTDTDFDGFGSDELANCGVYNSDDCDDSVLLFEDIDQDGYGANVLVACGGSIYNTDCNDYDPNSAVNALTYYADYDGDGFGVEWDFTTTCFPPSGYVTIAGDCYPFSITYADEDGDGAGSTEYAPCGTNNDDDCNDQDPNVTVNFYLQDLDGDGFGNFDVYLMSCTEQSGYVLYGPESLPDCDDNSAVVGTGNYYVNDTDNDGFYDVYNGYFGCSQMEGYVVFDANITLEDCDEMSMTYLDSDMDGYGSMSGELVGCGGSYTSDDCDDSNMAINPQGVESCNNTDDNCDGEVDEFVQSTFFADADGDGFGNPEEVSFACDQPTGFVANADDCDDQALTYSDADADGFGSNQIEACGVLFNTDCDDQNNSINPSAAEICNETDDNCSGQVDEGVLILSYLDADQDGFGDAATEVMNCEIPVGYVSNATDCNDIDDNVSPNAIEVCNLTDDNCNSEVDEFVQNIYYSDIDGDGFGDVNNIQMACSLPFGAVENADDCDDQMITYLDEDADGFGAEVWVACGASLNGDCDDMNTAVSPGQVETCNDQDDNCDGEIDEFVQNAYYADLDADGFGDANNAAFGCDAPMNYVDNMDDCDDTQMTFIDADTDGYGGEIADPCGVALTGDCDDANNLINPGVDEIEGNQVDENCDGELVGIAELIQDLISVYPNPSQGELNIKMVNGSSFQWQLYDAKGSLVETGMSLKDQLFSKQLGALNSGMYRLVIRTEDHRMYNWNWMIQH
jgi:Putative metal-binding motif/Secretion system C-terminal sorting domain